MQSSQKASGKGNAELIYTDNGLKHSDANLAKGVFKASISES